MLLAHRPDLVHMERGKDQSGEDLKRMDHIPFAYAGIWWYAKYPNHYAGDGSFASREIGELVLESAANQLVTMVRAVKKDTTIQELENRFFDRSVNPLSTKQHRDRSGIIDRQEWFDPA